MLSNSRMKLILVATGAATLLALAGCSGGGGGASAGQSKLQACAALTSSVAKSAPKLQESLAQIQSKPEAAVASFKTVESDFDKGLKKVSNAKIKKVGTKALAALKDVETQLIAATATPPTTTQEKLTTAATGMQTAFTDIGTACTSKSK